MITIESACSMARPPTHPSVVGNPLTEKEIGFVISTVVAFSQSAVGVVTEQTDCRNEIQRPFLYLHDPFLSATSADAATQVRVLCLQMDEKACTHAPSPTAWHQEAHSGPATRSNANGSVLCRGVTRARCRAASQAIMLRYRAPEHRM